MGLDVGLKKFENFEKTKKLKDEYEEKSNDIWDREMEKYGRKKVDELTDKERNIISEKTEKLAEGMGLDKEGDYKDPEGVELDSIKYPKHYWKIGYFRSSYNSSGFNTVIQGIIGVDLYDIFNKNCDDYYFKPDWIDSRQRTKDAVKKLKTYMKKYGTFRSIEVDCKSFTKGEIPSSNKEALDIFSKQQEAHMNSKVKKTHVFNSYSNQYGEFHLITPIKAHAFIKGF